jgi:hypothetical protein
MKNIDSQRIVAGFLETAIATKKQIKYNPLFMDHERRVVHGEINFMPAIIHPNVRVILNPNEFAISRSIHPNPKLAHANNIILMRGTQYGLIVMFGREHDYLQVGSTRYSTLPRLHAGRSFMMAAMRFFNRKNDPINLSDCEGRLLDWVFSPTFKADLTEQVAIDKKAGVALGDGLPPREIMVRNKPKPAQKKEAEEVAVPS